MNSVATLDGHFLPPVNEVWGEVMFLIRDVCSHGEGDITSCLTVWSHVPSEVSVTGHLFLPGWGSLSGGVSVYGFLSGNSLLDGEPKKRPTDSLRQRPTHQTNISHTDI